MEHSDAFTYFKALEMLRKPEGRQPQEEGPADGGGLVAVEAVGHYPHVVFKKQASPEEEMIA